MTTFLLTTGTMRSGTSMMADLLYSRLLGIPRHPEIAFSMEGISAYRTIMDELWKLPGNRHLRNRPSRMPTLTAPGTTFPIIGTVQTEEEFVTLTLEELDRRIREKCGRVDDPAVVGLKYTNAFIDFALFAKHRADAKMILLVRDPRNVYASNLVRKMTSPVSARMRILVDMLSLHQFIVDQADNPSILVVTYEELIAEREAMIAKTLSFLGVDDADYDYDSLLKDGVLINSSFGSAQPGRVVSMKGELTGDVANSRFTMYCSPLEVAFIEKLFADVFERFSYEPRHLDDEELVHSSGKLLHEPLLTMMRKQSVQRSMLQAVAARWD